LKSASDSFPSEVPLFERQLNIPKQNLAWYAD
jgi:hypothetical protein